MEYRINCAGIADRKEFHRLLAQTLSFPEWYGNNLDALYDCLTDLFDPTHLLLENWDPLSPVLGPFRPVLDEAEIENTKLTITYIPVDTCPSP